jgi:hypothetical protein
MRFFTPTVESDLELPASYKEALPELSPAEELEMRARTVKMLSELTGKTLMPGKEGQEQAIDLAKQMMSDPRMRPDYSKYPNDTLAFLAGMVAQSSVQIVDELSSLKMYVVNKLIMEAENAATSKDRISALKNLGDIDGIDAFKRRTEVIHTVKPIEEVEKELLGVLDAVKNMVLDGEYTEIKDSHSS